LDSYGRVEVALNLEEPDRVPLFEMHISTWIAKELLGREPVAYNTPLIMNLMSKGRAPNLNRAIAEDLEELTLKVGLDFLRVPHGQNPGIQVKKAGESRWLIDGGSYVWTSGTLWREDWGFQREVEAESLIEALKSRIEAYEEGEDEAAFQVLRTLAERLKGKLFLTFDSDGSWGPIVSNPPLLRAVLKWMYTDPELVRRIINLYTDLAIQMGVQALEEGADAILMCVDYGYSKGPWMSPNHFKSFVKPALERQCRAFKGAGGYAILHSDGNIWPILGDVVEAGVDAYQGIDVEAGMDLAEVKANYGDRLCLIGNVHPATIDFEEPDAVLAEVRRCIGQAASGGGYVLSSSANISVNKNSGNFILMLEAARRIGRYSP